MLNALLMLLNSNLAMMSICRIDDLRVVADSRCNRLSLYINSFCY